jgi:polyisoprenoid-binding protein YceI
MNIKVWSSVIGGLMLASGAQAAEYTSIQSDKSSLHFVYKQMGVPVDGSFNKFNAQLAFDPTKPGNAKVAFELNLASIDAGSDEANDEVSSKSWFNTKVYPKATFASTAIKQLATNRYEVSGKMTIKGRTQMITAPFTFTPQGNTATVDGSFVLKRSEFAIGEGMWADFGTVANEIQINFHFLANASK